MNIVPIENQLTQHGLINATNLEITVLSCKLGSPMSFYYKITGDAKEIKDVIVSEGNLSMSEEDYTKWGSTDDTYAEEWVLNKLNLTRNKE